MGQPDGASSLPIQKRVLHAGKGDVPEYGDGTRVSFHFVARLTDDDRTVLDDSRKWNKPMELVFGKKFKLEAWEMCVKTMRLGEVASFVTRRSLTHSYPIVAKTLRDNYGPKRPGGGHAGPTHMCSMMAMQAGGGMGYDDLNQLMKEPADLEFVLELLKVERPEDYEKDSWQLDADEKLGSIPDLKEEGNRLYRGNRVPEAGLKYRDALGRLEQLMLREKPGEAEWQGLLDMKLPIMLNYSQCCLSQGDYYPAIEHCTEVLGHRPDSVKALYRRAKAHMAVWNPAEAKKDFERVAELDAGLAAACAKEIKTIGEMERKKDEEDKEKLNKLFND